MCFINKHNIKSQILNVDKDSVIDVTSMNDCHDSIMLIHDILNDTSCSIIDTDMKVPIFNSIYQNEKNRCHK